MSTEASFLLPNILTYGNHVRKDVAKAQQSLLYQTVNTVKNVVTGELVTNAIVDNALSPIAIKPIAGVVGHFAHKEILSLEEEAALNSLVANAVDSVLTKQQIKEICDLAMFHISYHVAQNYEAFKNKMEGNNTLVGHAYNWVSDKVAIVNHQMNELSQKIWSCFTTAQKFILEHTSYEGRRGGLYAALGAATFTSFALSGPVMLTAAALPAFARAWNAATAEEDWLMNNQALDFANRVTVHTIVRKTKEKFEEEGYEISRDEEKKVCAYLDGIVTAGKFNLSPLQDALTSRVVSRLHNEIRLRVIKAIKPVAKWAIEQSAAVAKQAAEKGTDFMLTKGCKKIMQPYISAASIGLIASCISEVTPGMKMALTALPLAYTIGSAAYSLYGTCKNPTEEEIREDKLSKVFEKTIIQTVNSGMKTMFDWYEIGTDMEEKAFLAAKMVAKPVAQNLAHYILTGRDAKTCNYIVDSFDQIHRVS